jgi:beta-glucosidase
VRLAPDDLALFDASLQHVVEPDQFRAMVGASSADIRLSGGFQVN